MTTILLIISILLVTLYLGVAIWRMKCLPDSISALVFVFLFLSSYVQPDGWLGKAMNGKGVFVAEVVCYISMEGSNLTSNL